MKMENEIDSPLSGTVKNISVESGIAVEKGTLIMEIEE
jgi:biotin carboxyl carrier protein